MTTNSTLGSTALWPGTQTVIWCYDENLNGCFDENIQDAIVINWVR
ncbi:MAG: hypothetical protein M3R66_13705 [Actinomycetota bacterium]|nr:hypothetical protein [Actinomycetota bacterium]